MTTMGTPSFGYSLLSSCDMKVSICPGLLNHCDPLSNGQFCSFKRVMCSTASTVNKIYHNIKKKNFHYHRYDVQYNLELTY